MLRCCGNAFRIAKSWSGPEMMRCEAKSAFASARFPPPLVALSRSRRRMRPLASSCQGAATIRMPDHLAVQLGEHSGQRPSDSWVGGGRVEQDYSLRHGRQTAVRPIDHRLDHDQRGPRRKTPLAPRASATWCHPPVSYRVSGQRDPRQSLQGRGAPWPGASNRVPC
jgi:hypothetical protein